jgi:hypothetical protein
MKKAFLAISLLVVLSCGDDNCSINSALITEYSAEITILEQKIEDSNLEAEKAIYQTQINDLKSEISIEANKCD